MVTSHTQRTSAAQAVMLLSTLDLPCPNSCDTEAMEILSISFEAQLKRRLEGMLLVYSMLLGANFSLKEDNYNLISCIIVTDPTFWYHLQRFSRPSEPGVLRDILDGSEYKKRHRFVSQPSNVTFTLTTDGVSLFRSSSVDLWPIWLAINELPPTVWYVCIEHNISCVVHLIPQPSSQILIATRNYTLVLPHTHLGLSTETYC